MFIPLVDPGLQAGVNESLGAMPYLGETALMIVQLSMALKFHPFS
jgi:hypothetical protein